MFIPFKIIIATRMRDKEMFIGSNILSRQNGFSWVMFIFIPPVNDTKTQQ